MQNIFLYSNVPLWDLHFAEAIEIAIEEKNKGNKVFFYQCKGELVGCPANTYKDKAKCVSCINNSNYAVNKLIPFVSVINFTLINKDSIPGSIKNFKPTNYRDLENFIYDEIPFGGLAASEIAHNESDAFFDVHKLGNRINSLLINGFQIYSYARVFFRDKKINTVYVWNGRRSSDGPIVYAALKEKIKYFTFISGVKVGLYELIEGKTVHDLSFHRKKLNERKINLKNSEIDLIQILDEGKLFYKNQTEGSVNNLGLYQLNKNFRKPFISKSNKKVIAIFTSSSWEKIGQSDFKNKIYQSEYEGIKQLISNKILYQMYEIVVRWHPNLSNANGGERIAFEKIILNSNDNIIHITPDDTVDSYSLLSKSSAVITYGSTMGIEATYNKKISILLGPAIYDDLDVCYKPSSHQELLYLLFNLNKLTPKTYIDTLIYGQYMLNRNGILFRNLEYKKNKFHYNNESISPKNSFLMRIKLWIIKFLN